MKWLLRILGLVLVLALAGAGYWYLRNRSTAATAGAVYTQIVTVERGDLKSAITVVGELAAVQSATVVFEHAKGLAELLTLSIAPGDSVQAGDVLATIDPTPYQQTLDQARNDLQEAEQQLAELQTPATSLAIAQADQMVAKAEHDRAQAQADLADLRAPDLSDLQETVRTALDNLALAQLQQTLAEHDSLARSERDLGYAVNWHQRRVAELGALVAAGEANAEQVQELADERVALGDAQADLARVQAERRLALAAAAAEVAKSQTALADAQAALRDARAATAPAGGTALSTSTALALARAELAVKDAEVALLAAREARAKLDAGPEAATLAAAQTDVARKRLAVADAEAALTGATLRAPFAGTVLEVPVAAGDGVTANTNIATIADLGRLRVVASVDETTIRRVAAGQTAEVTFDALPGQALAGVVESVPLQGKLQGGVTVYQVPVALADTAGLPLLVGLTANVAVQTGQVTDALLVPALALQKVGGMYQVQVPNTVDPAGAAETVPVEVGLSDGTYTQVLRGLNEGNQVIVTLSEGDDMFGFGSMRGERRRVVGP